MTTVKKIKDATIQGGGTIVKWSINHPHTIISFYLGVFLLALLAIGFYMPRRMMPYVESPMAGVVTSMPGLSAEEMELYITKPIEEQLVNVKNLKYIRSSSQDGFSIVSLEFEYGTDMKKAVFDVQSLMNVIQAMLPMTGANLKPSWVVAIDPLNIPILNIHLQGQGWDKVKLREFADNEVINRLKRVKNVYSVVPFGGYHRQMQVIVDRDKLAAYGLSLTDVKMALDKYNVSRSGGLMTSPAGESIIRVDSHALSADMIANYPVYSSRDRVVYVKDIGKVLDTYWERRSSYSFSHQGKIEPGIEISVIQNPEASSALVVPRVLKELKILEKENPGIKFQVAYDNSEFVNILFKNMFVELGLAILLTGIVVLLFLGEWRGAMISLLTIPVSLAMAILGLIPLGMSLNSGTLIGLLLSIGRLVDDSIIDIHAVNRYLKMGLPVKEATIKGISEVRLAVIASTLTLILALAPLLFCGGIVELMFRELVWPLILGLLASMFVSFTLTSLLASRFLKPHEELEKEHRFWIYRWIVDPFQRFLEKTETGYGNIIQWMLKHRFANITRILATVIIGFTFYYFIGSEMMPLGDVGQAFGILEMEPGTNFEQTEKASLEIQKIFLKHPEILKVSAETGTETMFESFSPFYTGYAMPAVNAATFMITLTDKEVRKRSIWQVIDSVQSEALQTIPGIRRFQIKEMGSDVMASSAAPIQVLIYGKDLPLLGKMGEDLLAQAKITPGLAQPGTTWVMGNPSYEVKVDPRRAQEMGLTPDDVAAQLYYATKGGLTDEFYRLPNIRQNTILIRYEDSQRQNSQDLNQVYITGKDGRSVPLAALADVNYRKAPTLIEHDGLRRVITLNGYYRPGGPPSMDLSMDLMMRAIMTMNFPKGYGIELRGDMTQMMDSFNRLLIGLSLALFFIFLILVAQFRGFLQPLQMVFSLPLELSGVFIALFLAHQAFSTVSIMAVIVLTGMDVTAAILLVDMISRYRDEGIPRDQAVVEACPQRLRPILMTTLVTLIVMVPVAFFPGTGMDAYSPLGTVIVGGLLVGTILTLFDIPIMHTYVDDFTRFIFRRFLKKEYHWRRRKPEDDSPDSQDKVQKE